MEADVFEAVTDNDNVKKKVRNSKSYPIFVVIHPNKKRAGVLLFLSLKAVTMREIVIRSKLGEGKRDVPISTN